MIRVVPESGLGVSIIVVFIRYSILSMGSTGSIVLSPKLYTGDTFHTFHTIVFLSSGRSVYIFLHAQLVAVTSR